MADRDAAGKGNRKTPAQRAVEEVERRGGVARAADLRDAGIHPQVLADLVATGRLGNPVRGVYVMPDPVAGPKPDAGLVAARVPALALCLHSAAFHHELVNEVPLDIWMIGRRNMRTPVIDLDNKPKPRGSGTPKDEDNKRRLAPVRLVRSQGMATDVGIETSYAHGVPVRVTDRERTVCDLIRYQKRPGSSHVLAVQALANYLRAQPATECLANMATSLGCWGLVQMHIEVASSVLGLKETSQVAHMPAPQEAYVPGQWWGGVHA